MNAILSTILWTKYFLSACKTDICRSIVDIGFATGTSSVSASGSTLLLAVDADSYLGNYNHGL